MSARNLYLPKPTTRQSRDNMLICYGQVNISTRVSTIIECYILTSTVDLDTLNIVSKTSIANPTKKKTQMIQYTTNIGLDDDYFFIWMQRNSALEYMVYNSTSMKLIDGSKFYFLHY